MKNLTTMIIAVAMVFLSFNTYTTEITGTVTSAEDGKPLPGINIVVKGTSIGTVTDITGHYSIKTPGPGSELVFSGVGFQLVEVKIKKHQQVIDVALHADVQELQELVVTGYSKRSRHPMGQAESMMYNVAYDSEPYTQHNTEEYTPLADNIFHSAARKPLSTFSIDVDNASYSNIRRFINQGRRPPEDAVRIEEMINYFNYEYPQPAGEHPFSLVSELSECPWSPEHKLVHIGIKGKDIPREDLPASNLVFLIDVSGSMNDPNKLPLLKSAYNLMVDQLDEKDRVAIVVYAGAAGTVLPSTPGDQNSKIKKAINKLQAGGSTAGNAGIQLAYQIAQENFIEEGNNRVILATDGDFNVGVSSTGALERIISEKKETGVYLSVLGFGFGNYKDSRMEVLADKGNGNYAYIDNISEAKKVLVDQLAGTLYTIAKDVKIQVEFNPARVKGYRLIGYVNRKLNDEDFHDDKKDAGELGVGHTVTALYEVIPVGIKQSPYIQKVDDLKYQQKSIHNDSREMLTLKLRYKEPNASDSQLIENVVMDDDNMLEDSSDGFRHSAAVAAFGMLLRDSQFIQNYTYQDVALLAREAKGNDKEGYRMEFIKMVESMALMASN